MALCDFVVRNNFPLGPSPRPLPRKVNIDEASFLKNRNGNNRAMLVYALILTVLYIFGQAGGRAGTAARTCPKVPVQWCTFPLLVGALLAIATYLCILYLSTNVPETFFRAISGLGSLKALGEALAVCST